MFPKAAIAFLLVILTSVSLRGQEVPAQIQYCGMTLHLASPVQEQISEYISQIYKSPRYFNEMVRRAQLYMPMIERAFRNAQVPEDLKYLAIQESGLRPSVVSSSQALGFWQFKAPTALDLGLEVSEKVDERRHILRSSQAAAQYLGQANWDFDNWVYAVIAYYEGPTGSVKHTDPQYYARDTMRIEKGFHWYALKAIAHKLAYEEAINSQIQTGVWLEAHNTQGETNVRSLLSKHEVDSETFFRYNAWILDEKRLPKEENYIYFVPKVGLWTQTQSEAVVMDAPPSKAPESLVIQDLANDSEPKPTQPPASPPTPQESTSPPVATNIAAASITEVVSSSKYPEAHKDLPRNTAAYVVFNLSQDLHYNYQYVQFDGSQTMTQIADRYGRRLSQLLVWNGLLPGEQPMKGSMVYLFKPSKQEYHIVRLGESLEDIGLLHNLKPRKLQKLNHMKKQERDIYIGQKMYLKKRKPSSEKTIILRSKESSKPGRTKISAQEMQPSAAQQMDPGPTKQAITSYEDPPMSPTVVKDEMPSNGSAISPNPVNPNPVKEVKTRWITHRVGAGETLWQISKRYDTKVEIIKMINKLESDAISEGQSLRILAKEEKLD